jgi:phosphotransferase system enzyme I (PtsP)
MLKKIGLLFREASLQPDRSKALELVLDWVVSELQVDVCALYEKGGQSGQLDLLAVAGSPPQEPLPSLAGQVAAGFAPLRVAHPWHHPGYGPEPNDGKRVFHAYLGVPIIRLRQVLGVLEAQRRDDRQFTDEDASLLLTLTLQLAGMIGTDGAQSALKPDRQKVYTGVPAAPGVAVGRLFSLASHVTLDSVPERTVTNIDAEVNDFRNAVEAVQGELRGAGSKVRVPEDLTALYQAYEMLLSDPHLIDQVIARIRRGQCAPTAVRDTTRELIARFEAMDDAYLQARAEDIRAIGRRILFHLHGHADALGAVPEQAILLGQSMGLTCITGVPAERLVGLVCTGGSPLSHAVIVARALGIPAIIGAGGLIPDRCDGREVILDGYRGRVILDPTPEVRAEFLRLQQEESDFLGELSAQRDLPSETSDGRRVSLEANISLLNEIPLAKERGAAGVGLYRSEFPFLLRDTLLGEDAQYAIYSELLRAFHPLPVTIRALDAGGDKVLPYLRLSEDNPALGQRGIRLCLDHPEIFLPQLRALLRSNSEYGNLRLLLPMVTLVSELQETRRLVEQVYAGLQEEGQRAVRPPLGIMVEVPAAVFCIDELAAEVDFVSIGTNDLTQYVLAADRTSSQVGRMCDPFTPAVLAAIGFAVEGARRRGVAVSVCGELAGDPLGALLMLGLGVDALSMAPGSILRVKQVIRGFSAGLARELWERSLQQDSARGVRAMLTRALENKGIGGLVRPGK